MKGNQVKSLKNVKANQSKRRLGNELELDIGAPHIILDGVCRGIGRKEWRRDEARRGYSREDV
jgi:hypothetical protein